MLDAQRRASDFSFFAYQLTDNTIEETLDTEQDRKRGKNGKMSLFPNYSG